MNRLDYSDTSIGAGHDSCHFIDVFIREIFKGSRVNPCLVASVTAVVA